MKLDDLLRAHGFMKIERPPEIWEADIEDVLFVPLLGEMIAAGLGGGAPLEELVLNVSNVVVPPGAPGEVEGGADPPRGEYVAVTIRGATHLGPDDSWRPGAAGGKGLLPRLGDRLTDSRARYAYVRRLPGEGSITVFFRRSK